MVYVNVLIKIACEQALFSLYSLGAVEATIAFLFTLFSHYYILYSLSDFSLAESGDKRRSSRVANFTSISLLF